MSGQVDDEKVLARMSLFRFVQKDAAGKSVELAELHGKVSAAVASGGAADGGGHQEIQHSQQ